MKIKVKVSHFLSTITVIFFLILVYGNSFIYADEPHWEFKEAIIANNFYKAENIIRYNVIKMNDVSKETCVFVSLNDVYGEKTLLALQLLARYKIIPNDFHLFVAFSYMQPISVIDFILPYINEVKAETIKEALEGQYYNYLPRLIFMCKDLNSRSSRAEKYYVDNPDKWDPENSKTALIKAVEMEHFPSVKLLVEAGANLNLRAEYGSTAASIAYDKGNIEIYDYLMAHGAREFTPRYTWDAN
jgi:hypothetical protein